MGEGKREFCDLAVRAGRRGEAMTERIEVPVVFIPAMWAPGKVQPPTSTIQPGGAGTKLRTCQMRPRDGERVGERVRPAARFRRLAGPMCGLPGQGVPGGAPASTGEAPALPQCSSVWRGTVNLQDGRGFCALRANNFRVPAQVRCARFWLSRFRIKRDTRDVDSELHENECGWGLGPQPHSGRSCFEGVSYGRVRLIRALSCRSWTSRIRSSKRLTHS